MTDWNETKNKPASLEIWGNRLVRQGIICSDMDEETLSSFMRFMADLKLMEPRSDDQWILAGFRDSDKMADIGQKLSDRFESLSGEEKGSVLIYFLPCMEDKMLKVSLAPQSSSAPRDRRNLFGKRDEAGPERASDLSNLQIVKKVGRQMKPFLELEEQVRSRLEGVHTRKEDVQRLVNYIFSKTQPKAPPRQWEQISRKRHH